MRIRHVDSVFVSPSCSGQHGAMWGADGSGKHPAVTALIQLMAYSMCLGGKDDVEVKCSL